MHDLTVLNSMKCFPCFMRTTVPCKQRHFCRKGSFEVDKSAPQMPLLEHGVWHPLDRKKLSRPASFVTTSSGMPSELASFMKAGLENVPTSIP